ncbi:MAG TPA: DsbA family protein, partial [Anaeromyxobacteraceae bacterium]|nr:DsbA family protein [Anaeromyxobacteraceae bacterium]
RGERPLPSGSLHLHRTDGPGEWLVRAVDGEVVSTQEHAKGDAAVRGSREPELRDRVAEMGRAAAEAGVTGIPTFDVGGERVVGAQPYAVLAAAVERQGGRRRLH